MFKILKKIVNNFIFFSQRTLQIILNLYITVHISNFGFRSKSKILVKYLFYSIKYRNAKKSNASRKENIILKKNNNIKKKRLNLNRFIVFKFFSYSKKNIVSNNEKKLNMLKLKNKINERQINLKKNRYKKAVLFKNCFFLNTKLNENYFNLKSTLKLRKKFKKIISKSNKNLNKQKNLRFSLVYLLINKNIKFRLKLKKKYIYFSNIYTIRRHNLKKNQMKRKFLYDIILTKEKFLTSNISKKILHRFFIINISKKKHKKNFNEKLVILKKKKK